MSDALTTQPRCLLVITIIIIIIIIIIVIIITVIIIIIIIIVKTSYSGILIFVFLSCGDINFNSSSTLIFRIDNVVIIYSGSPL